MRPRDIQIVKWESKNEEALRRNLRGVLKIIEIEKGKPLCRKGFWLDAYTNILAANLSLIGIESVTAIRAMVQRSCFRLKTLKRQDVFTFRRVLAARARKYLRSPEKSYHVVMLMNIDPKSLQNHNQFSVVGVRLTVRTWKYIAKHFDQNAWKEDVASFSTFHGDAFSGPFIPLTAKHLARDPQVAFEKINDAFDLLRAAINSAENFGKYSQQFGGLPRPLGRILRSPVYGVFDDDGKYVVGLGSDVANRHYRLESIEAGTIKHVKRVLSRLLHPRGVNDTSELVLDAFRKYGQALETSEWKDAFLNLWQILELLTYRPSEHPDDRFSMKEVCARAATLVNRHELLTDLIWTCQNTRNALVHRGRFSDDGLQDVSMLKSIVEHCIGAVLELRDVCPTWEDLVIYYQNAGVQSKVLADRARIIRSIRRRRNKN